MAAREDEPEAIVGDRHRILLVARIERRELRLDGHFAPQEFGLLAQALAPAQSIDGAVPRGRGDPGTRIVGHASHGPRLEGRDEGFLDHLLGEVEVAEHADQGGHRPALFLAEQAVDDLVGGRVGGGQTALAASSWAPMPVSAQSTMGRTSTDPFAAPGISAA